MDFSFLPEDIVYHILSYSDTIKYRNGKYMNQICKQDERYSILRKITPIRANIVYSHVYETYTSTYSGLFVDLENNSVVYTFCYDMEKHPDIYHLWIRE